MLGFHTLPKLLIQYTTWVLDASGKFNPAQNARVASWAGPQMLLATEVWQQAETTTMICKLIMYNVVTTINAEYPFAFMLMGSQAY